MNRRQLSIPHCGHCKRNVRGSKTIDVMYHHIAFKVCKRCIRKK